VPSLTVLDRNNSADFAFMSAQNQPSYPGLRGHWELWPAQLHIVTLSPGVVWPKAKQLSREPRNIPL